MRSISKTYRLILLIAVMVFAFSLINIEALEAQCAMCAATAQSNLQNGGAEGKGLNRGILYLLSMPYLLVATLAFLYWRNKRKTAAADF